VVLPAFSSAWSIGSKLFRSPEVTKSNNSQTMGLLESHLNFNSTGTGGAQLAIVDDNALAYSGEEPGAFIDLGKSGTGQISVYIVRKGDTLAQIAKMFGVSVNTIVWANDIKNGKITPGDELVILPITGVRHIVKSGDTIATIAKKYNAKQSDVLSYNGMTTSSKLAVGDEIIIPDGDKTASTNPVNSAVTKVVSGLKEYAGYFLRPVVGGRKSQGIHGHNAIDLAAPVGTPIVSAASGTVIVSKPSGYNGGYGIYVVVSHANGTQTVYAHMSANYVKVGETVEQGEMIGRIGMTGNTSGPHIHFEIRGAKNPF
jgi:LysM repeat protein